MILDILLESALRSLVLSLAVGLGLWITRTRGPRLETTAWALVLAGALLMPFLMRWRVIELNPPRRVAVTAPVVIRAVRESIPSAAISSVPAARQFDWRAIGLSVYAGVAGVLLVRLLTGLWLTLRLCRRARRVQEPWCEALDVRETEVIGAPATFGSSILLPVAWHDWEELKLRAVIAHERAHVVWGDFYVQLLGRMHVAVFWFSPVAWWLENRLIHLAEAASDDAALHTVADRTSYAEILLGLARKPEHASAAVAMARPATIRHRVERVLSNTALAADAGWKRYAQLAAAVVCLVAMIAGLSIRAQAGAAFLQAQPPAAPVKPPAIATLPQPPKRPDANEYRSWWWQSGKHGDAYAIVSGDSLTMSGSESDAERARSFRGKIPGEYVWFEHEGKQYLITDPATVEKAKELFRSQEVVGREQAELAKKQARLVEEQALFAARQAGASVKMPALDDRVQAIRTEMQALEKRLRDQKLGELAVNDQLLGKLQDELRTAKDKELTQDHVAELQAKTAELQSLLSEHLAGSLSEMQSRVAELQSRFAELQSRIEEHQSQFDKEQALLGEELSRLAEQQSQLGAEQSRRAEQASRELRRIIEECLQNGLARPAK